MVKSTGGSQAHKQRSKKCVCVVCVCCHTQCRPLIRHRYIHAQTKGKRGRQKPLPENCASPPFSPFSYSSLPSPSLLSIRSFNLEISFHHHHAIMLPCLHVITHKHTHTHSSFKKWQNRTNPPSSPTSPPTAPSTTPTHTHRHTTHPSPIKL